MPRGKAQQNPVNGSCWKHGWGKAHYVRDWKVTKTSLFQGNKEPSMSLPW